MVTMAAAQSQKLEQDSFEGVDDDEWVCYSSYKTLYLKVISNIMIARQRIATERNRFQSTQQRSNRKTMNLPREDKYVCSRTYGTRSAQVCHSITTKPRSGPVLLKSQLDFLFYTRRTISSQQDEVAQESADEGLATALTRSAIPFMSTGCCNLNIT
jgi:hypothetical protein